MCLVSFQTLIELLEHVHQNEVGGAAGIDHSNAALSQLLLSPDSEYLNIPGAFLDAERSSLEFYKVRLKFYSALIIKNEVRSININWNRWPA